MARDGITPAELAKAKSQLNARLVFENDSVTNIAHQIGYFETIAGVDVFAELPAQDRRRHARTGRRRGTRRCSLNRTAPSAGSIRLPVENAAGI